jgi:hypothetical protein
MRRLFEWYWRFADSLSWWLGGGRPRTLAPVRIAADEQRRNARV